MRWRSIEGWEGLYEVSDHGDVRSLDRLVMTRRGGRVFRGKVLKQHRVEGGYFHVALSDGKGLSVNTHVLVAAAFVGPCPDGMEVCHKDGTRTNNYYKNLRYGTRKSNAEDRKLHGTNYGPPPRRGGQNHMTKLTEDQVLAIRKSDQTLVALGKQFGVHFGTIHAIKARKTWAHLE